MSDTEHRCVQDDEEHGGGEFDGLFGGGCQLWAQYFQVQLEAKYCDQSWSWLGIVWALDSYFCEIEGVKRMRKFVRFDGFLFIKIFLLIFTNKYIGNCIFYSLLELSW